MGGGITKRGLKGNPGGRRASTGTVDRWCLPAGAADAVSPHHLPASPLNFFFFFSLSFEQWYELTRACPLMSGIWSLPIGGFPLLIAQRPAIAD